LDWVSDLNMLATNSFRLFAARRGTMPAVALTGAVIIEQKGNTIRWKKKCEKCGWVDSSTTSQSAPSRNATSSSGFSCPKCKNRQNVKIQGA
jgi:hypothetical protein